MFGIGILIIIASLAFGSELFAIVGLLVMLAGVFEKE